MIKTTIKVYDWRYFYGGMYTSIDIIKYTKHHKQQRYIEKNSQRIMSINSCLFRIDQFNMLILFFIGLLLYKKCNPFFKNPYDLETTQNYIFKYYYNRSMRDVETNSLSYLCH